ncbi:MAG: ABC transporter substrate-binding protein [Cyclobacteriaceae bacterium]
MKAVIYIMMVVLPVFSIVAQEEMANYKKGLELLENEGYEEAMELFRPYINRDDFGILADYSRFHFARAAYGNRQFELAKNALSALLEKGKWGKTSEATYLLALTHFQQSDPSEALKTINSISEDSIREEAFRATYDFLKVSNTSVLMVQYELYPDNKGLAMALREKLGQQSSLSSQEKEIFDRIEEMDFLDNGNRRERKTDQILDIALILPFNYDGGIGVSGLSENNFVFQLYQGINLGVDQARSKGMELNVRSFDTERNESTILGILNDPYMMQADLIIGPIYPEETNLVAEFGERYKIPHINPLSNVHDNISQFDFSYLFRPSVTSISERVIEYCRRFEGKKVAVAYSGTTRDESLAKTFVDDARKNGFQVVLDQQVNAKNMRDFFENIQVDGEKGPAIDMMVIFSDDPNVASPTFAMVESLAYGIPVIVMDSWLYFNFASYEMMEIQNFHFIGNNTVEFDTDKLNEFREDFLDRYKNYPSQNAYLGYELITLVTDVINEENGFDFQGNLDKKEYFEGTLTFGFNFNKVRYNNFVPILRLDQGMLEIE